ncbi:MAG: TatD family hydrolase [Bacilli bacterium]
MLIDTHCHLSKNYYTDIAAVVAAMNGIIIVSGVNDETNREVMELVSSFDNVYGTLGIHPTEMDKLTDYSLKFIEDNLENAKIVAIGEIGLDYRYISDNKGLQQDLFIKQINLANRYNKPIVIHNREATLDVYEILKKFSKTKKLLHCYSSSLEMAYEFVSLGVMFGIGGSVTFKNAKKLIRVVRGIDLKYLLLETDSPYMTPSIFKGKQNEPCNVKYVANTIAEIKGIPIDCVVNTTSRNAIDFFDILGR